MNWAVRVLVETAGWPAIVAVGAALLGLRRLWLELLRLRERVVARRGIRDLERMLRP